MNDVPLEHAMLVWNRADRGGGALVVLHPDAQGIGREFYRSAGACFADTPDRPDRRYNWVSMTSEERLARLLVYAWQATARDGVSQIAMHRALCVIPEFRAEMTSDMLDHMEVDQQLDNPDEAF